MRKHITRLLLAAMTAVLSLALVFGLGGCAPTGPKAYTAAAEEWNNAVGPKTANDNIVVTAVLNLGNTIGTNVTLTVDVDLSRKYDGDEVDEVTATVNSIAITNLSSQITNLLPALSSILPEGFNINDYITDGGLSLIDPAEGSITMDSGDYVLEGSVDIELFGLSLSTSDLEEEVAVSSDDVEDYMETFGISIAFDSLTLYNIPTDKITKENTAVFTGAEALDYILQQVYDLFDNIIDEEIVIEDEPLVIPPDIKAIITGVFGGLSSDDIADYLFGDNGLIDLGNVDMTMTYDGKKLSKLESTQNISFAITKTEINRILALDSVAPLLVTESMNIGSIISGALAFLPATIAAEITVEVETTYIY